MSNECVADPETYALAGHIARQAQWSKKTFGPGPRTLGIIDHIKKELMEVEDADDKLSEWIDVLILALDGCWRTGATPTAIVTALLLKQTKNENREWPDWRGRSPDEAIEHVRT